MPGPEFYKGLTIAESLVRFAEHHVDQENRHISSYEYQMLILASEALLEDDEETDSTEDTRFRAP